MEIKNAFVRIDGLDYPGTTIYTDGYMGRYNPDRHKLVISSDVRYDYLSRIPSLCSDFVPNPGDEIHVVPDCPLTTQDIRNNYKIKRGFDEGVCNVFSDLKEYTICRSYNFFMFDEKNKILAVSYVNGKNMSFSDMVDNCLNNVPKDIRLNSTFSHHNECIAIEVYSASDSYLKLLEKKYTKPCVYYKNLKMNRNELTIDALTMLYNAGMSEYGDSEALKNLNLVLATVSQYNWKEYPFTVSIVQTAMSNKYCVYKQCYRKPHLLGKAAKDFVTSSNSLSNIKQKDYALAQEFVGTLMNIKDTRFVDTCTFNSKLSNLGISMYDFSKMFDTITKVSPKKISAE